LTLLAGNQDRNWTLVLLQPRWSAAARAARFEFPEPSRPRKFPCPRGHAMTRALPALCRRSSLCQKTADRRTGAILLVVLRYADKLELGAKGQIKIGRAESTRIDRTSDKLPEGIEIGKLRLCRVIPGRLSVMDICGEPYDVFDVVLLDE